MDCIHNMLHILKNWTDDLSEGFEPWQVILITALTTLGLVWTKRFLCQEQSVILRSKQVLFKIARKIPMVQSKIELEMEKVSTSMVKEMNENIEYRPYITKLPEKGWTDEQILKEAQVYTKLGKFNWEDGSASGTVYNGNKILTDLMTQVYGMSAWSNPLHADVFPGVRKMEAEVVQMTCSLFNGGIESCGTMSSGGTESIMLACKVYRDYAREIKGIKHPEMVIPITAHAAFDKGAQLLNMKVKHVPIDPITMKVNMKEMQKMITKNTCMLVGSAPHFPHGVIDPIEEISGLGIRYNIPVHVDSCLGGFLVPFMEAAGYPLPLFDFRLPGVTSISADTHKYGYAPKGSSVIMYREAKWRHFQYFVAPDWPGGIYATATMGGSRAGGIIAACWASLMYHGFQGYVNYTRKIIETAKKIENCCRKIDGIFVYGKPDVSVVAIGSNAFNIYDLFDHMGKRGWNLNALQYPSSVHIAVTVLHTEPGVAERFIKDIKEISSQLTLNKPNESGGSAAIYGLAQSIPDRSLVGEMAWIYLDACYSTTVSNEKKNVKSDAK